MAADTVVPTGISAQAADSFAPGKQPKLVTAFRFVAGNS
jgi:hypothetical protein